MAGTIFGSGGGGYLAGTKTGFADLWPGGAGTTRAGRPSLCFPSETLALPLGCVGIVLGFDAGSDGFERAFALAGTSGGEFDLVPTFAFAVAGLGGEATPGECERSLREAALDLAWVSTDFGLAGGGPLVINDDETILSKMLPIGGAVLGVAGGTLTCGGTDTGALGLDSIFGPTVDDGAVGMGAVVGGTGVGATVGAIGVATVGALGVVVISGGALEDAVEAVALGSPVT